VYYYFFGGIFYSISRSLLSSPRQLIPAPSTSSQPFNLHQLPHRRSVRNLISIPIIPISHQKPGIKKRYICCQLKSKSKQRRNAVNAISSLPFLLRQTPEEILYPILSKLCEIFFFIPGIPVNYQRTSQ
jgi:hypothetical protein